jgi:hypothetical protein
VKRVASTIAISASPDQIWPFLAEFDRWPQWGISISAVESEAQQIASGVTGRVRTRLGLWLPFTINRVDAHSFWDWTVAGVRATEHYLNPRSGYTQVGFTAPWLVAPYTLAMNASLRKLKQLVESQ